MLENLMLVSKFDNSCPKFAEKNKGQVVEACLQQLACHYLAICRSEAKEWSKYLSAKVRGLKLVSNHQ